MGKTKPEKEENSLNENSESEESSDVAIEPIMSKEDRFKLVANRRVNFILNKIRLLGNFSNKSLYAYSEEQIKHIFNAIKEESEKALNKILSVKSNSGKTEFTI